MNLDCPLINPILETCAIGNQSSKLEYRDSKDLGRKRAVVVSGPQGLDEAGLDGETLAMLEMTVTLSSFQPDEVMSKNDRPTFSLSR